MEIKKTNSYINIPYSVNEDRYIAIENNNLNRWLVGQRSCWYIFRKKTESGHVCFYSRSKLIDELLDIYENMSVEERCTFVYKASKKAE